MKLLLLLIVPVILSQLAQTPPFHRKTLLEELEKEPWYFCDADSLWTYGKNCRPVRCTDPSVVKKLRVETVLEEVYLNGYDDLSETDSVIPGKTLVLTASKLRNLAYPLNSFGNLVMLDVSNHYFNSFPSEVFDPPQLKVLNISGLCTHDLCEPCLYKKPDYEWDRSKNYEENTDALYRMDLSRHHAQFRKLLLVRYDHHFSTEDIALLDSLNEANRMLDHEPLFENAAAPCLSHEKKRQFHDVYMHPVKP